MSILGWIFQWFDYANIPKDLLWLDLSHNQIEDLANYYRLADGFSLKTLDASSNNIKKVRPLSGNLKNIHPQISGLRNKKSKTLSSSLISELDSEL